MPPLAPPLLAATKVATLPDVSVGHLLGHTVLALIVIVGGIWLVQRIWTRNRTRVSTKSGRPAAALQVISRTSLGKDHHLAVVRWGDREVLVGISGSTISFFDDGSAGPVPTPSDLYEGASADSDETLSTFPHRGRSSFANSLSSVVAHRREASAAPTTAPLKPVLERLRDLTERS